MRVLQRILGAVLRVMLVTTGLAFVLVLVVAGSLLTLGLLIWSLATGRKPRIVNLRWARKPVFDRDSRAAAGEVVDVQAREVSEPPQALPHDQP